MVILFLIYKTNVFVKLLKLMMMYNMLVIVLFLSGVYMFVSLRKHLLSMLLSLEFIMLSLFMFLFYFLVNYNSEMYVLMMFLIFMVCEGALGLSILVSMIRTHGNNYFQSFNILMC
uniref:NADH-ubiquinone oxidoreductase chain 4L n=1 Tax=Megaselia scalaris TaxID=36166 RepID=W8EMJ3_MEGSC|nr:NADH dehydrogenase subunit 4L [Megaselia scalaris]AHJ91466.1 NADH dehydrogenase subunit 4L [Megaselia scalaris]